MRRAALLARGQVGLVGLVGLELGDPHFDSVVLLANFNGADAAAATTDVKGHALTFVGNAQLDTAAKQFGESSLLLDGTGDYLTTPDSDDWYLPDEFTIEAWVRPNFTATTTKHILSHGPGTAPNFDWTMGYTYQTATTKRFIFTFYPTGAATPVTALIQAPSENIDQSAFHHVAAARDSSDVLRLFVDGVEKESATVSGAFNGSGLLYVGASHGAQTPWQGWIDSVRITKGVCRYAADFTPVEFLTE